MKRCNCNFIDWQLNLKLIPIFYMSTKRETNRQNYRICLC
jgi:hypothetical protein